MGSSETLKPSWDGPVTLLESRDPPKQTASYEELLSTTYTPVFHKTQTILAFNDSRNDLDADVNAVEGRREPSTHRNTNRSVLSYRKI